MSEDKDAPVFRLGSNDKFTLDASNGEMLTIKDHRHVFDPSKVETVEDVALILEQLDLRIDPNHVPEDAPIRRFFKRPE